MNHPQPAFKDFFEQFGASCRRKHIDPGPVRGTLRNVRSSLTKAPAKFRHAPRPWPLPASSPLPDLFIRLDPWEMDYMFHLAASAKVGMLETGRFNGGSMFLMAWANRTTPIYSIDIAPQDDALAQSLLTQFGIGSNLTIITGDSQHARDPRVKDIDLLFVDGDHSYEGCMNDLENWWPMVVPGGHVVLHDCYGGSDVQRATQDFLAKHRPEVVRAPHIPAVHWQTSAGSIAHFRKP